MPGVVISGLTKRFGDVAAVAGLDLTVRPGELVALLGPSGCGKTTTLRLVAGFMAPDAGEIRVGDRVLSSPGTVIPPERRRMAMIFQSYALWPHMTVAQNVAYGLRFGGTPRADREAKVERDPPRGAALGLRRALSRRALRRPAAAGGGGARPGGGARDPVAGRAALQPRREPPRGDALRDSPAPRALRHHHAVRHPRPGRGDGDLGPGRGDPQRPGGADRRAARALRAPAHPLRRRVHRQDQPDRRGRRRGGQRRPGPPAPPRGRRRPHPRGAGGGVDPPARDRARPAGRGADARARHERAGGHRPAGELPRRHGGLSGHAGGQRRRACASPARPRRERARAMRSR